MEARGGEGRGGEGRGNIPFCDPSSVGKYNILFIDYSCTLYGLVRTVNHTTLHIIFQDSDA